jgi:uncharacterized protein (TIGR02246 family)
MNKLLKMRFPRFAAARFWTIVPAAAILMSSVSRADAQTAGAAKEGPAPAPTSSPAEPKPARTQAKPSNGDEAAIRATAEAFLKAFNARDAKAVASLWTANGTIADGEGNVFRGRKAIEDEYAALFKAHPTARMQVAVQSVDFPAPTTAIEEGEAQVLTRDNTPPSASRYTAVHVLEEGKWFMASVHESPLPVSSNFAQLQQLGWLVGNWESKVDGARSQSRIRWIANKSFLQRDFSVQRDGLTVSSGTQIVGWDPRADQIVSWTFDSSGGHGMGRWTASPQGWRIESAGTTADGAPTSSNDLMIRVPGDENVFGWRSADRRLGEAKLPDIREVVFDRTERRRQ